MNSSDRGTTDVERYDLDSSLPLLHGLIDHLDLSKVKEAKTNEEKVPYLLPMLGVESSSSRLKASMLEIQETITTWPQLASGVVFGGGICTDVCRRILLDQFTKSGRYFVDTEQAINDEVEDYISLQKQKTETIEQTPNTGLEDYENELAAAIDQLKLGEQNCDVSKEEIDELVRAASLAPSGGNSQPWKWIYKYGVLFLFVDKNRTDSVLNYSNIATFIAHGAAIENMIICSNDLKLKLQIDWFPLNEDFKLSAVIRFTRDNDPSYKYGDLLPYLTKRYTNRMVKSINHLTDEYFDFLQDFVTTSDRFSLKVYTDREKINDLKEVMTQVDELYYTSELGHQNFSRELRWTPHQAQETKDGVEIETIDLTPTEEAGFRVSKKWDVVQYLKEWELGAAYSKLTSKGLDAASALVVIVGPNDLNAKKYVDCGRLIEQLWLTATARELAFQPMSISSFLFTRAHFDNSKAFSPLKSPLLQLDKKFRETVGISENDSPLFIFRLSKAEEHKVRALRRDLKDLLIYE